MTRVSWLLYLVITFAAIEVSHSARVRRSKSAARKHTIKDATVEDADIGAVERQDQEKDELDEAAQELQSDSDQPGPRQAYNYGGNYNYGPGGPRKGTKNYNPGLVDARGNKLSEIDWEEVYAKLPSERGTEAYEKRSKLWRRIDINGNGWMSLAELDRGIRDELKLDTVFNCKPAIMRAFQAAKNINGKTAGYHGDYVERNEFRALLEYLRKYFELYVMYRHIDTNFDGRVSLQEFNAAVPKLQEWGISVSNPTETFNLVDIDGGGMLLFDEFAAWAIRKTLSLGPDGPGGAGLESAEGPSHDNLVNRPAPDVAPAVSLSLNGEDPEAKSRLIRFYKHYQPEKVSAVDTLLRKYRGKERLLFEALVAKYGPEPGQDHGSENFDDI